MRKKFSSAKFNKLIEDYKKTQVTGIEIKEPSVRHPFFVSNGWANYSPSNPENAIAYCNIEPGFCNAKDCNVITLAKYCSTETIERVKEEKKREIKPEERIEAYLAEMPKVVIPWRHVNAEAGAGGEVGAILSKNDEKIPDSLLKLGARGNSKSTNNFTEGSKELFACDVWLHHERWYTNAEISINDPFATASLIDFNIGFSEVPQAARRAEIRLGGPFKANSSPRTLIEILLGVSPEAWDALMVAKIWALSPPPNSENWTETPSPSYQILIEQKLFWGVRYLAPEIPPVKKFQPIRMGTGLLNGIADQIFNSMLAFVNDTTNLAANILASLENRKGRFFTI